MALIFLLVLNIFISTTEGDQLQVNTNYGKLQGKLMTSREGRVFSAFLGIRYAAAPTGLLRFMPPEPPPAWDGLRNCTEEGNICVQRTLAGKEDCLYLNVFTHGKSNSWPVMVYIHGGGFYGGSNSLDMYGPQYLMDKDVVLVTLQYRLGVFGFLSTEDGVVPGNMGLKDQVRALQWVQGNIRGFGGDPAQVTIFGNSAGSASVHLHMLSSRSRDLFARAISQSGTAFSAFSMIGKGSSRQITKRLADHLNCPDSSSIEIIKCLQSKDPAKIQEEYGKLQDSNYEIRKVLFRPVVEEPSEHSFLTFRGLRSTTNKPWLVGVNSNEGLFKINLTSLNETAALIKHEFSKFGPAIMFFEDTCSKPEEIAQLIYNFYFKNTTTRNEVIVSLEQMISDSWFLWPTMKAISQHNGTLHCYLFDHNGQQSFTQVRGGPRGFGVSHMDELHYLFPQRKVFSMSMNEEDSNISKLLVNLWTAFAKGSVESKPFVVSNNPQSDEASTITWTPSSNVDPLFLHIETRKLSMVGKLFEERMNFWKSLPIRDKMVW